MSPWDVKDLVARLKSKGLPIAEEMAKDVEEALISWIDDSVIASPDKLDDLAVPVLAALKPLIDAQLAKISPQP